jgi:FkbM family methyltransferase
VRESRLVQIRDSKLTWPFQRLARSLGFGIVSRTSDLEGQLIKLVERFGIRYCLDVGAHEGEFIRKLERLDLRLETIAIEPSFEAAEKLRAKKFRNVQIRNLGLGASTSRAELFDAGSVFASVKERIDSSTTMKSESVQIDTLDKIALKLNGIEFERTLLKIDTQGSELDILHGAQQALKNIPLILVEAPLNEFYRDSFKIEDLIIFMRSKGFAVSGIHTPRFNDGRPFDCDMLFSKNNI